jgi:hypothetical protein
MKVSRRAFVTTASCAAAASLCAIPSSAFTAYNIGESRAIRATLLDLETNCALRESLAGMRAALGSSHRCVAASNLLLSDFGNLVIVAAAGSVMPDTFSAVAELLRGGATVLWESGAAFLNSADFAQQQALTKEHFGISIGPAVPVWPPSNSRKPESGVPIHDARGVRAIGHEQVPYVAYRWPLKAHVRDFSRVIPVFAPSGHAIAHWNEAPVAWSKNVEAGTLVFLGSPLGPALLAGDAEATALFQSLSCL